MKLSHLRILGLCEKMAATIKDETGRERLMAHPVPRGGVPVAYMLKQFMPHLDLTGDPNDADIFVDDIVDSGTTMERFKARYPGRPFFSMINKEAAPYRDKYIVFPWEGADVEESV